MPKHVCILVAEHPFLDARIFKKEARSLVKAGYQVTMIVPRRNGYLFDVDGTLFTDSFREEVFMHEGIKIITYEEIHHEKRLKTLYKNIQKDKGMLYTDPLIQLGIAEQADIYHAHEFYSLYTGVCIKHALSLFGKDMKLIYDCHEVDPDPLIKQARRIGQIKFDLLKQMLKETDFVIPVSDSIQAWIHSIDATVPTEVIYNSPPLTTNYHPGQGKNKPLVLVYEGVMNEKRGSFRKLMKVIEVCNTKFPLHVVIIGGNKKQDPLLTIPSHVKDKVTQTGWIDYHLIPQMMEEADLGWVDLDANQSLNNRFAMPNKFFSYLNNGIPVIVNGCKDMKEFIEKHHCGYAVKGLEATVEDYFQKLLLIHSNRRELSEKSENARRIMEKQFSWEQMEKRLLTIYEKL